MDTPIQVDLGRIAQDLQIRRVQVESVVQLLDEGNTVAFIARYRKERTGNLNEVVLHEIQQRVGRLRDLAERKNTILKSIESQGKLTEEVAAAIRAAENPKRLEDLYIPFKPKKRTKASEAREKGLEPLAERVWNRDEALVDLHAAAAEFVNAEKDLADVEKVLEGVRFILAEVISEFAVVREAVRRTLWRVGKLSTSKTDSTSEAQGLEYRDYFKYGEPLGNVPPHRVLAINRGEKQGILNVRVETPRPDFEAAVLSQLPLEGHPQAGIFRDAAIDSLDRLLLPSLEREVRRDLTDLAERHAVEVFAKNLRGLLLQPPIAKQTILALDPGFRNGCKYAVLDGRGNLLEHGVIYPHAPQNRRHEAKTHIKDLVGKHAVEVIAIGNGTACRETEELIAEAIAEGLHFHQNPDLPFPGFKPRVETPTAVPDASSTSEGQEARPGQESSETPAAETSESAPAETVASALPADATHETHAVGAEDHAASPSNGDPGEHENVAVIAEPSVDSDLQASSGLDVEHLPPITGGAPDDGEHEVDPVTSETAAEVDQASHVEPSSGDEPATAAATLSEATPEVQPAPAETRDAVVGGATSPAHADEAPTSTATVEVSEPSLEASSEEAPVEASESTETPVAASGLSGPPKGVPLAARPPVGPVVTPKGEQKPRAPRPPRQKAAEPAPPPAPHPADARLAQLAYVIVNEAGASVYSASPIGREEFPDFDVTLRSAISIGRRLLDPLSEMVKIEPQNIGVGLYQHDVNPKQLKESLEAVTSSCVNFVGVDLNTAGPSLLRQVSGLNQLTARRIVDFRKERNGFKNRRELLEVEGIGPVTFTQAAGFLKLLEGDEPLDRTWVHPESYPVALKLLEKLELSPEIVRDKAQREVFQAKAAELDIPALARELEVGEPTLRDIVESLLRPERDPREDLPKPIFKKGVLKFEDLTPNMELLGTVLNVVDFGAFVDIGLKDSGLVHISQLANRYVKSPHDIVCVGDVVTVWVLAVDQERKRVSLTMVKPGTERPRGPVGSAQGQGGQEQGSGGGRRGGGDRERRGGGGGGGRGSRPGGGPRPVGTMSGTAPAGSGQGEAGSGERAGGPGAASTAGGDQPQRQFTPRSGGGPGRGRGGPGGASGMHRGPGGGRPGDRGGPPPSRPPARPSKPSPPPPPLSKEALEGNVPLRTFGQLKQLWQARTTDEPEPTREPGPTDSNAGAGESAPHGEG